MAHPAGNGGAAASQEARASSCSNSDMSTVPGMAVVVNASSSIPLADTLEETLAGLHALRTPDSWNLDAQKDTTEADLAKVAAAFEGSAKPPEAPPEEPVQWTDKMRKLQAAIDAGKIDVRGALGQDFQRQKAVDPELKKKYEKIGTNRAAQNLFKCKWAKTKLDAAIVVQKTQIERGTDYKALDGYYRPFGRIVWLQGDRCQKIWFPSWNSMDSIRV